MKKDIHPSNYREVVFKDMSMMRFSSPVPLSLQKRQLKWMASLILW